MILNVSGLDFNYAHRPILDGVSFHLERGHVLGVLGVNGAGKSTLLRCLNRILSPRAGRVFLEERDLKDMNGAEIARHFGYVPQKYSDESLTVFDTVLLGRKPYIKWSASKQDLFVVAKILKRLHLEHLAHRPANQLSGGELQKVIIARALAQEPEVLLLDEPTSNLDLRNQLQVMNIVCTAVRDYGVSAVVSLHDINLAFRFADHFLMLKEGKVHTLAPREAVVARDIEDVYGVKVILSQVNGYQVVIPIDQTTERKTA